MVCLFAVITLKPLLKYDDSLDVFGVHGVGGILGGLLLGVFASTAYNEGGADGLIHGDAGLLIANLKATVAGCLYAALVTFVLLKALQKFMGLRVDEEVEIEGLDQHLHGEKGYSDVGTSQLGEG